jgi:L-lactate dehydrogenase complex protein LldF
VLSPQLTGIKDNASLPFASTLCGACFDACPVAIDIPSMLVHLRGQAPHHVAEAQAMRTAAWVMRSPRRYTRALRALRVTRWVRVLPPPFNRWTRERALPVPPEQTFRDWWASR